MNFTVTFVGSVHSISPKKGACNNVTSFLLKHFLAQLYGDTLEVNVHFLILIN